MEKSAPKPIATDFAGAAVEQAPGAEDAEGEGDDRAGVEGQKQPRVEDGAEVEVDERAEEQAGDGEALGEDHQPVDRAGGEDAGAGRGVAGADHQEDRQDDEQDLDDHPAISSARPS